MLWVGQPAGSDKHGVMTFADTNRPTPPMAQTTPPAPTSSRYASQVSGLLLTAFGLSAGYTVWTTASGLAHDSFTATNPWVWAFYVTMIAVALLVRTDRPASWTLLAVLLPLLLSVGVFVYPTTFTSEQQTPFGWFENDVYLGLLMIASYLTVQRLRRRHLMP